MRCEHAQCTCETDSRFCSDHCRQAVEMPETMEMQSTGGRTDCGCGHAECTGGLSPLT